MKDLLSCPLNWLNFRPHRHVVSRKIIFHARGDEYFAYEKNDIGTQQFKSFWSFEYIYWFASNV